MVEEKVGSAFTRTGLVCYTYIFSYRRPHYITWSPGIYVNTLGLAELRSTHSDSIIVTVETYGNVHTCPKETHCRE